MTYLELLQLIHDFKHGFITFDEFKSKLIDRTTKEFMDRKYIEDVAEINMIDNHCVRKIEFE